MKFKTINPATEEVIAEYELMPKEEVLDAAKNPMLHFRNGGSLKFLKERIILEG